MRELLTDRDLHTYVGGEQRADRKKQEAQPRGAAKAFEEEEEDRMRRG